MVKILLRMLMVIGGTISATEGYIEQSEAFIAQVNRVIEEAHALGHTLIYIKSEVANPLINILNNTLARGSEGAEFDKRLLMKPGHVITKRKNETLQMFFCIQNVEVLISQQISYSRHI
ncbi:MAG: hypothetical protein ABFS28_12620 [Bacteroidota bacterium]